MIRELHLSDLPRQALPGRLAGQDLACSRETLMALGHRLSLLELARYGVAPPSNRHALAMVEGLRLRALAVVQPRHGSRAWELAHLYASSAALVRCGELLEQSGIFAAQRGGERLFLRLEQDSPLQVVARRAGFFPAFAEEVYGLTRQRTSEPAPRYLHLRAPSTADFYGLFRLYNASVPVQVRSVVGLTLGQWADAQEKPPGHVAEYVWERDGELRGWLRTARHASNVTLEAMLHPNESAVTSLICNEASRMVGANESPMWVVPTYQDAFAWALQQEGWTPTQGYMVLVKQLAKAVQELSMAPIQA